MGKYSAKPRLASTGTFPYIAGEYLHKNGPQTEDALFDGLKSTLGRSRRDESIQGGLRSGWLVSSYDGKIDCSEFARSHYDKLEGKPVVKFVGQVAAPREAFNAYDRPPLRKAYMPNARGTRLDIPAWSVRENASFKIVAGGEA
jgi:hypothetical protein